LLRTDKYIKESLEQLNNRSYGVKILESSYAKIRWIRYLEDIAHIGRLDINSDISFQLKDSEIRAINNTFRFTQRIPETPYKCKQLYISMIKNLIGNEFILKHRSSRRDENGQQHYNYDLDIGVVMYHLELNKYKNKRCTDFDEVFINKFGIICINEDNKQPEFLPGD
jgi:hypothetical protein